MDDANTFDKPNLRWDLGVHTTCEKVIAPVECTMTTSNRQISKNSNRSLDFDSKNKEILYPVSAYYPRSRNEDRYRVAHHQLSVCITYVKKYKVLS